MGRQKIAKNKQLSIIILFRSDKRLHDELHIAAEREGLTISKLLRRLIINYLTAKKIWNKRNKTVKSVI